MVVITNWSHSDQWYLAQILDLFMLFDDISSSLPPPTKKNRIQQKKSSCSWRSFGWSKVKPPAVDLTSFRLVPFICNIFTLVLMAGGAVRQGVLALQQPRELELFMQQLLSLKRLPGAGMLLRSQLIIALRSSPRWMSGLVLWARNLFDLFSTISLQPNRSG